MPRKSKLDTPEKLEVLSARVPAELYKQIVSLSRSKDLTVTQIVRASIREYIARNGT